MSLQLGWSPNVMQEEFGLDDHQIEAMRQVKTQLIVTEVKNLVLAIDLQKFVAAPLGILDDSTIACNLPPMIRLTPC